MAVTNEQVLTEIAQYRAENNRPCPAKHLAAKLGDEALEVIGKLKKDGILLGMRGRTGGLVPASMTTNTDQESTETVQGDESIADQFAALAAKLAADDAESVAV